MTRRGFISLVGIGALALAGCATSTEIRRAVGADGTIEVPKDPRAVVSIDYFTGVFLLELGITPVGGIDYTWVDDATMYPEYVSILKAIPPIGGVTETNLEAVAALDPDLILGPKKGSRYDNSPGTVDKLMSVAPVVTVDFGTAGDWRGPFAEAANAVGKSDTVAALRAEYERVIAEFKSKHAAVLSSTKIGVLTYAENGNFALDLPLSGDGVVLSDVGVQWGAASIDDGTNTREISFEQVSMLEDCDVLLYRADADGQPASGLADVLGFEGWKSLPAVAAGRAYPIGWNDLCTYKWAQQALTHFGTLLDGM